MRRLRFGLGVDPGTVPGDEPGLGTDDQIPGSGTPSAVGAEMTAESAEALAETGGTASLLTPLFAGALIAAGALLIRRRRTV